MKNLKNCIVIKIKSKEIALEAIKLFSEYLKDKLNYDFSNISNNDNINIKKGKYTFYINIDAKQLFNTLDYLDSLNAFVNDFIKQYPNDIFYLENIETFNNKNYTRYMEYKYDKNKKELTRKIICSKVGDGSYNCPECKKSFKEQESVYLLDYDKDKNYVCPHCETIINFDIKKNIEIIKLDNLYSKIIF
jgi:DNA-directed RNA polymerase subunit RPC12/RpoP